MNRFLVNNEEWQVLEVSPYHPMLINNDGFFTLGACDDYLKTIFLNENLSDEKLFQVLCHELTHAAMFSYNIYLPPEQEELIATIIASYGEEIIDITEFLFKKIKGSYY